MLSELFQSPIRLNLYSSSGVALFSSCVILDPASGLRLFMRPPVKGPFVGRYTNWTGKEANDLELEIQGEGDGEGEESDDSDTFPEKSKSNVKRYIFRGKKVEPGKSIKVEIAEDPSSTVMSWTFDGKRIGATEFIPSHQKLEKGPDGANDFHIESKDEIAGFWCRKGTDTKIDMSHVPADDYPYKVDVTGIDGDLGEYWLHYVKNELVGRHKWWWTKGGAKVGTPGEG